MIWEIVKTVLIGAGTGLVSSLIGYAKSIPDGDKWDWKKVIPMFAIGILAGGYAAYNGVDLLTAESFMETAGIVFGVNYLWAAVYKFYQNKKNKGTFVVQTKKK